MKGILGYEGLYFATECGKIITTKRQGSQGGELVQKTDDKGYKRVQLTKNGKQKTFLVHRLIATTYIPNPENKRTVNHKDGNTSNNHTSNLEWATHSEQMVHSSKVLNRDFKNRAKPNLTENGRNILKDKGKAVGLSNKKTTEEDEALIMKLYEQGYSSQKISEYLGTISRRTVSRIIKKIIGE